MINVGIVGSTCYGGCQLVRFLLTQPNVNIEWVSSRTYSDQEYSDVYKSYFTLLDQKCVDEDIEKYLDNVIVHELSHLIYPNHSSKFWELVEENFPKYKQIKKEMKEF